jgi:hypothetical protein
VLAEKPISGLRITKHPLEECIMNVDDLRRHGSQIQAWNAAEDKRPFLGEITQ